MPNTIGYTITPSQELETYIDGFIEQRWEELGIDQNEQNLVVSALIGTACAIAKLSGITEEQLIAVVKVGCKVCQEVETTPEPTKPHLSLVK